MPVTNSPPYFIKARSLVSDIENLEHLLPEQYPNYQDDYQNELEIPKKVAKRVAQQQIREKMSVPTRVQPKRAQKSKPTPISPQPQRKKEKIKAQPKKIATKERKAPTPRVISPKPEKKCEESLHTKEFANEEEDDLIEIEHANQRNYPEFKTIEKPLQKRQRLEIASEIDELNQRFAMKKIQNLENYQMELSQIIKKNCLQG